MPLQQLPTLLADWPTPQPTRDRTSHPPTHPSCSTFEAGLTARQNEKAASEDVEVVDVAQLLLSSVKRGTDGASADQPDGDSDDGPDGSSGGAAEHGGEAEVNGKADVPTDSEATGTPLPDQDKS